MHNYLIYVHYRFDEYGLRYPVLTRPICNRASDQVYVLQLAPLTHASFRPSLTATPLRFSNPSPPSGWIGDFHSLVDVHARHTRLSFCRRLSAGKKRIDIFRKMTRAMASMQVFCEFTVFIGRFNHKDGKTLRRRFEF